MLKNLNVTQKLRLNLLISFVFLFLIVSIAFVSFTKLKNTVDDIFLSSKNQIIVADVGHLSTKIVLLGNNIILMFGREVDQKLLDELAMYRSSLVSIEESLSISLKNKEGPEKAKKLVASLTTMINFIDKELIPIWKSKEKISGSKMSSLDDKMDSMGSSIENDIRWFESNIEIEASESLSVAQASLRLKYLIIVLGIVSMVLAVFMGLRVSQSIEKLLRTSISELGNSSETIRTISKEVQNGAQKISEATGNQASSVQETTASIEEIAGMVTNNLENTRKASEIATEAAKTATEANQTMQMLQKAMDEILSSNEKIEQLVKVIDDIGEKTKVMNEIVFQTKLLSFNASVEAERAGEHGRGFAVVAQEVGNLAQMSGKAAQEIASIVKDSIRQADNVSKDNKAKVEEGSKHVESTYKVLQSISKGAIESEKVLKQVLDASKEQTSGIKQISMAMNNLDKAIQEHAAYSAISATSADSLDGEAEKLTHIVSNIAKLVNIKKKNDDNKNVSSSPKAEDATVIPFTNTVKNEKPIEVLDKAANDEWEKL